MPCAIYLTHPETPTTNTRYLIRPPRLRSDLRGDAHWAPWWRSAILVQSSTSLPLPSMSAHDHDIAQGYLLTALTKGIEMAKSFLSSLTISPEDLKASPPLLPTPDGAYIISHLRKDTSSQLTSFVISLAQPQAYAMLATLDSPIKIRLPTTITIAGSHHQQIVHIQVNPHNRSILGRAYLGLFQNPLTQTLNPEVPMPIPHPTKGLTGRRSAKLHWAALLLNDLDTLHTYEEYARESYNEAEDQPPPTNTSARKTPHQDTRSTRQRGLTPQSPGRAGTPTGPAEQDGDPAARRRETSRGAAPGAGYRPSGVGLGTIDEEELPEAGTSGSPFDPDYPPQQSGDSIPTEPSVGVYTENFFTPSTRHPRRLPTPAPTSPSPL